MSSAALETETTHTPHTLIPSDRVEGTAVRRSNGEKIGEIKRVMIDKTSGKVAYAVMRFGGFLGMGEKYHPLPWDALRYNTALEAYELNIADEQLRNAPSYGTSTEFDWGDRELHWLRNVSEPVGTYLVSACRDQVSKPRLNARRLRFSCGRGAVRGATA